LWFFTENNYGNQELAKAINANPTTAFESLPRQYYTVASVPRSSIRFVVNKQMFMLYVVLQSFPLLFAWIVFIWTQIRGLPNIRPSSFPLLDYTLKVDMIGNIPTREEMMDAGDATLLRIAGGIVIRRARGSNLEKDGTTSGSVIQSA
jgi:hypothetical protein